MNYKLVGTITSGSTPRYIAAGSGVVYATDALPNVYVDSIPTRSQIAAISAGTSEGIAITPDGSTIYAAAGTSVAVISTATNTVTTTVGTFNLALAVAANPVAAAQQIWVTDNTLGNTVNVISTASNTVTNTINEGTVGEAVVVSPDGTLAYVYTANSTLYAFSTTAFNAIQTVAITSSFPTSIAASPDGQHVYLGYNGGFQVVSTSSWTVTATVSLSYRALDLAVTPDSTTLAVLEGGTSSAVNFYNVTTATPSLSYSVTLGNVFAQHIAQKSNFMYVTEGTTPGVAILGTTIPPTRQFPRDDNLAVGSARQSSRSSSAQNSIRQGRAAYN